MSDQIEAQKTEYDAHRLYVKIHFNDEEMDFIMQWILGSTVFGGCEIGEAFYVAGNIQDGSPESWQSQWENMARQLEQRAVNTLAGGHAVTARENYFKACNYFRTAQVSMMPSRPLYNELGAKCRSTFREACKLFDPPIQTLEIPFEGTTLPGYYQQVDSNGDKRKTLVMIGGVETMVEELYFYIAPAAIRRGYNFLSVDLPGQGMLPAEGQYFRSDSETPIKAIIDHAQNLEGIDFDQLAMYGISGGGYFVPRAATFDDRIKACAVNTAVVDVYKQFLTMPNTTDTPEELAAWSEFKKGTAGVISWRWGLDEKDISGLAATTKGCQFDPAQVKCPSLVLVGEGEYANQEVKRQVAQFMDNAPNAQNKFVMTEIDQGASSHCIGGNRSYMSEVVFDWLDEVFPG